jgi:hypothetical protein
MQDAINLDGCPVASLNPEAFGPSCDDRRTHTIMIHGRGPVNVCKLHAELNDQGRPLIFYTEEPAAVASNG